jgi:uncharacterized membrane protein YqjE
MQFTIHYDEAVLRRAVDTFFRRRFVQGMGLLGLAAFALCTAVVVTLLVRGDRSWFVGVMGAVLVLFVGGFLALWRMHRAQMSRKLEAIPSRRAEVALDAETITVRAESGSTSLPWSSFSEVWKLPDCWLLFLAPNSHITLPLRGVPQEALDFIDAHLPESCKRG